MIMTCNEIKFTRGDSYSFIARLTRDGESMDYPAGSQLFFTVAEGAGGLPVIQKIVTEFDGDAARVDILPEDTAGLQCGPYHSYCYDLELRYDGNVATIVPYSPFVLGPEVTLNG